METSKNKIEILITVKRYEGYTVKYRTRADEKITFPVSSQKGSRLVRIGSFEIYDYDHSARFIKEGQRIKIEAPFCFDAELDKTEIELNSDSFSALEDSLKTSNAKRILVYLCVDSIDELKCLQNLEEEHKFVFKWEENSTSPNSSEQREAKGQAIKPYVAHAIQEIAFVPLENCLEVEGTNTYNVTYAPEDTDGYRFHLGNIVIRNLQKIPYKYPDGNFEQVSLPNLQVYLTLKTEKNGEFPTTVGYIRNDDSFVNTVNVNILNGHDDITHGVFVDWEQWKNAKSPIILYLRVFTDNWREPFLKCKFKMAPQYFDDVYSLDLGTSGIVVAMQKNGEIRLLELEDQDIANERIEKNDNILSSVSILKRGTDYVTAELAPRQSDTYEESTHILVPAKFIVGQHRIPFLNYNDEQLKLESVHAYGSKDVLDMHITNDESQDEKTIKNFIKHLYANVFSRFGKKAEEIKKIIVTYPNTYTSETLEEVKFILKEELGLKLPGQISFVPESDAVAASYFNQRIYNGGFPREKERVIIYDMGAGTLDLSLVEFCRGDKRENRYTARILNKIGIPIAGNYLDYIIYKGIKKFITEEGKEHKGQLYLKEAVSDFKKYIPKDVDDSTTIGELKGKLGEIEEKYLSLDSRVEIQKLTYSQLLGDAFKDYLEVCSSTVIDTLLLGYQEKPDTIVFSGRASQLLPLKSCVRKHLKSLNPEFKEDAIRGRTSDNGLKVCVAEGALKYMDLFDKNSPYKIENKNQYANVAVIYWGEREPGIFDVKVRYLLEPNKADWNNADKINGTICQDFHCKVTLDNIVNRSHIYYVQTSLEEEELKKLFKTKYPTNFDPKEFNPLKWGFVNILLDSVIYTKNQEIDVELEITKDNVITKRRVDVNELKDKKILENVENNVLYRHSMWPNVK